MSGPLESHVANRFGVVVVERAFVEGIRAVLLRSSRGRQVVDDHLKKRNVGRQPGLHDSLHERLAHQVQVSGLSLVLDLKLFEHRARASSLLSFMAASMTRRIGS